MVAWADGTRVAHAASTGPASGIRAQRSEVAIIAAPPGGSGCSRSRRRHPGAGGGTLSRCPAAGASLNGGIYRESGEPHKRNLRLMHHCATRVILADAL